MHVLAAVWIIVAVWIKGYWKGWENYLPTMMFFSLGKCFASSLKDP
jgi:hypothetical protein